MFEFTPEQSVLINKSLINSSESPNLVKNENYSPDPENATFADIEKSPT
jgi:hypothetical protein